MTTLVDSNVILDVVTDDSEWGDWSSSALASAAQQGRLVINPLIYAEVACGFPRIEDLDAALPAEYFTREPLPWPAAFLAAQAFLSHRRRGGLVRRSFSEGGSRPTPLPDFFIGAHAAVAGYRLLTRDRHRYKSYFPKLTLITP